MKSSYSLPTAKPYAFKFDTRRTALVIIDVQKDFVDPSGFGSIQCGSPEIFASVRSVVGRIKTVLDASRSLGIHIIHTREGHVPDLSDLTASKKYRQINNPSGHHTIRIGEQGPMGKLLVRGEQGHGIVDELAPWPAETVVDKSGKGSFWATNLHRKLMARGITHLLFAGVTTECCVTTTVREANDRGFECCILSDCTSGFNASFVEISMEMISAYDGLFGYVAPSQDLLAQCTHQSQFTPPLTPPAEEERYSERSLNLESLRKRYISGVFDPIQLVNGIYDYIEANQARYSGVWIHVRPRAVVLEEASRLAKMYSGKPLPPLYGAPFAVKDNFDVAGIPTTAGCEAFKYTPAATAPSVAALIDAGALLIGKTNMDQLATGLSGCRSPYGTPTSIYGQSKYISGGSSSGSGVAVAARMVTFALGTDTAGSGRVPAALNGIVGLKPTKGTISTRGVVPACKSLDTVSIFATCVTDARTVWHILDVHDPEDEYAKPVDTLPLKAMDCRGVEDSGFTYSVPSPTTLAACSPAFQIAFAKTKEYLKSMGGCYISISDAELQLFHTANELLYKGTLVNERIACIGHKFVTENMANLHPTTAKLFDAILARDAKPWDLYTDQITQAECMRKAHRLFEKIDIMVFPAVPYHPTLEEMNDDPIGLNAKMGEFTHFANVLDLCAININASFYECEHGRMPFGISLVGGLGMDGRVIDIASHIEKCTY